MLAQALARDGFRCVITGFFDATSLQSNTELQRQKTEQGGVTIPITPCHILNESTTQGTGTNEKGTVVNKVCTIAESSISIRSHPLPRHIIPLILWAP